MKIVNFMSFIPLMVAIFATATSHATSPKGKIAVFQYDEPIAKEVVLPEFTGGPFKNGFVHFANLPTTMVPDSNGCYCYDLNDDRFAFVHAYFYANQILQDYNQIFLKLNLPPLHDLELTLSRNSDAPTSGDTNMTDGRISYPRPALDITTLGHEIGHFIHYNAMGQKGSSTPWTTMMEFQQQLGVQEGTANLLSALHFGTSRIGFYDSYDAYDEINNFVQFPSHLLSTWDYLNRALNAPLFSKRYPIYIETIKQQLALGKSNPAVGANFGLPFPYSTSAVINQPLWIAATTMASTEEVKILYVRSISELKGYRSYSDLANKILDNARVSNMALCQFLRDEYRVRGLDIKN